MGSELNEKERMISREQIILGGTISAGLTLVAIGMSIWLTVLAMEEQNSATSMSSGLKVLTGAYTFVGIILFALGMSLTIRRYGTGKKASRKLKLETTKQTTLDL